MTLTSNQARKSQTFILRLLLACTYGLSPALLMANDSPGDPLTSRYIALAIQGDLPSAHAALLEPGDLNSSSVQGLLQQYEERFIDNDHSVSPPTGNSFADDVVQAYRVYWTENLLRPGNESEREVELRAAISRVMTEAGAPPGASETLDAMGERLSHAGLFYLESPSPPFRDFYLWQSQTSKNYVVRLTDQTLSLEVVFMDDFVSLGWKEYASLGLATTTGWVENNRLYCVAWAYDRDSENFRVSYLKHEARHLADLKRYPDMDTTELEYRAKLTELAFAHTSLPRMLDDFTNKAADNPASPHAMANHRIVNDLHDMLFGRPFAGNADAWRAASTRQVNQAARSLLIDNTKYHSGADR